MKNCLVKTKSVLLFSLFLYAAYCSVCLAQDDELSWPVLRIPDAFESLSDELVQDVPFDLSQYYGIDDDQNREQLYLQFIVEYAMLHRKGYALPRLEEMFPIGDDFLRDRAFQKRYKKLQTAQKRIRNFIDDNNGFKVKDEDLTKVKRWLAPFEPGIKKLRKLQNIDACFFHEPYGPFKKSPTGDGADFIVNLLELRFGVDAGADDRIDDVAIWLGLSTDLSRYGSERSGEINTLKCLERIVGPMLSNSEQTPEQLDELIEVLKVARQRRQRVDPVLERARYEYLIARSVFLNLKTKAYLANPKFSEAGEIRIAVDRFRAIAGNTYPQSFPQRWANSNRPPVEKEFVKRLALMHDRRPMGNYSDENHRVFEAFVAEKVLEMTDADFDRDFEIFRKRYQQIDAACKLPYVEATKELGKLRHDWVLGDDQWKDSPLLLMNEPGRLRSRVNYHLPLDAYLCLASLKKWKIEHNDEEPTTLTDALRAIGVDEVVVDPYSPNGKQLRRIRSNKRLAVYSIGKDHKNNKGKQIPYKYRYRSEFWEPFDETSVPTPEGDIVFEVKW